MKEKEFNLSEKRRELFKKYRLLNGFKKMILEQDKEFIKRLKEQAYIKSKGKPIFMMDDMYKLINQLAGDKLIEGKK